ncbi:MAG: hypothetical protein Q8K60_03935 [Parachlamydiaceae bacterium]|nr:hypothetical protein [Parachlamydiaceae bacterium]
MGCYRLLSEEFSEKLLQELESLIEAKHIKTTRGSLILWDSRTIHWNQHPN